MTPPEFDFTIIPRAGLTQKEFAVLTGVSRVTVNLWSRGKMRPHRYIKPRTIRVINTLETAVANGLLPIPSSVALPERGRAIKHAIRQANETVTA
jgi:transcriptional regulator with XRE-family HTH domain